MMTTTSYLYALVIYWLAAGVGCRLLYVMVFRHLSPMWSGATTGLVAGLLLVPSYAAADANTCLLYTSPSPRDKCRSRMPSSA